MGAPLLVGIVLALSPPPTEDGAACQAWTVEAARALLTEPQPPATGLAGVTSGGLAEIPDETWTALGALGYPSTTDAGAVPGRMVEEGTAPLELRGAGADRVVVANADPAFDAEELRLPVPEGTPRP